jgi:hypothetical protein
MIKGSSNAPKIKINPGCIKSVVIIILRGHYSEIAPEPFNMAIPLGKNNDQYAGDKAEKGPPSWNFLNHGMGRMLVDKRDIKDH